MIDHLGGNNNLKIGFIPVCWLSGSYQDKKWIKIGGTSFFEYPQIVLGL